MTTPTASHPTASPQGTARPPDSAAILEPGLRSLQAAAFCGLGTQHIFLACVTPLALALSLPGWLFSLVLAASGLAWIAGTRWWSVATGGHARLLREALAGLGLAMLALAGWTAWVPLCGQAWPPALHATALLACRAAMSFCLAGIPVLALSWLAAHAPAHQRARTLSRQASAGSLGMVLAPAVAAMASQAALPWVLAATALLPLAAALRPAPLPAPAAPVGGQAANGPGPAGGASPAPAHVTWPLRLGAGLAYGGIIACNLSLAFLWTERHGLDGPQALFWSGLSLAAAGLGAPLAQAWTDRRPWSSDRHGVQVGALLAAAGLAAMALSPWAWMVPPCLLLTGLGVAWMLPHLQSAAMAGVGPSQTRAVASRMAGMQGWAMLAAPAACAPLLVAGAAWPALAAAAALLLFLLWPIAPLRASRAD